ncbi:MAG: VOC family protein [Patescibacteria group bacterium]
MKTSLQHLSLNVSDFAKSASFYKDLLGYFEFKIQSEGEDYIGFSNGATDIWLGPAELKYSGNKFHRKNPGLNHLAFQVGSREDDAVQGTTREREARLFEIQRGSKEFLA